LGGPGGAELPLAGGAAGTRIKERSAKAHREPSRVADQIVGAGPFSSAKTASSTPSRCSLPAWKLYRAPTKWTPAAPWSRISSIFTATSAQGKGVEVIASFSITATPRAP